MQLVCCLRLATVLCCCLQASKQRIGRIVPEGWVNDVLTNSNPPQQQQHHGSSGTGAVRGAAAAGLARQQLLAAGLSSGSVDHLYRCLYVYSMGFVDSVKVSSGFWGGGLETMS